MTSERMKQPEPFQRFLCLTVNLNYFKSKLRRQIRIAMGITDRFIYTWTGLMKARLEYDSWDDHNSTFLRRAFVSEENIYAHTYDSAAAFRSMRCMGWSLCEETGRLQRDILRKVEILQMLLAAIRQEEGKKRKSGTKGKETQRGGVSENKVFVVHGHNREIRVEVERMLEKLGLCPVVLNDQPGGGMTVLEKFERYAEVGFALILLTADDLGRAREQEELKPRARQNVILELGYFMGRLGRQRVCALCGENMELPSDLNGFMHIEFDRSGGWKMQVVRELKMAGYDVDMNRIV